MWWLSLLPPGGEGWGIMKDRYRPDLATAQLLAKAYQYIQDAPYAVTARWVFYRLLQDGTLSSKADYKCLLGYLSKARKRFYAGWTPSTLADESREAMVRGGGFTTGNGWVQAVANQVTCNL